MTHGQDREGSEGSKRTCSPAEGSGEPGLPLQADWIGSRTTVAMAVQRSGRSRVTGDLCRNPTHAGGAEGADQQDRPQRCARHCSDDPGGAVSSGACEDAPESETANAADPSQASAVEGHRDRERSTRYFAQLRPQGRNGWQGEVRGPSRGGVWADLLQVSIGRDRLERQNIALWR